MVSEVLVRERDIYMADTLRTCLSRACLKVSPSEEATVVGVVGIGHAKGIRDHWEKVTAADVARVCVVPRPSLAERSVRLGIKLGFYGALLYGGYRALRGPVSGIVARVTSA